MYDEYLERRYNMVIQEQYEFDFDKLMRDYSFTNLHAVTEEQSRGEYDSEIIQVPEVQKDYYIAKNKQRRNLKNSFKIHEKPEDVDINNIRFIKTSRGNYQDFVYVIFKCKDRCTTIFTEQHIAEIDRFATELTSDPLWSRVCRREGEGEFTVPVDDWGCTESSYFNITRLNKMA